MLAGFLERRGINKYQENLKQQSAEKFKNLNFKKKKAERRGA
jgi:hypothetical protein